MEILLLTMAMCFLLTSHGRYNLDHGKFNTHAIRNSALNVPYFHEKRNNVPYWALTRDRKLLCKYTLNDFVNCCM